MSSVHYKFRSSLESKCHNFDGLHISVAELKKAIYSKEGLREESFELVLSNAHTRRTYADPGELIPRNSSVIVQRMPRENASKLPKVQDTSTSGIVQSILATADGPMHIGTEDYDKMTEEERIQHMENVSSFKYQPANYKKRSHSMSTDKPPPPTYLCKRCNQSGHWCTNCPMLNTKRTTGIPMEELMETTEDDPQAMLHPSGKYVIPIMHHRARLAKQQKGTAGGDAEVPAAPPPPELVCPLCNKLFSEAVVMVCCGNSFCGPCVQQRLLDSDQRECPGEGCTEQNVNAEKLVPNINLRKSVAQLLLAKNEGTNGRDSPAVKAEHEVRSSRSSSSSSSSDHRRQHEKKKRSRSRSPARQQIKLPVPVSLPPMHIPPPMPFPSHTMPPGANHAYAGYGPGPMAMPPPGIGYGHQRPMMTNPYGPPPGIGFGMPPGYPDNHGFAGGSMHPMRRPHDYARDRRRRRSRSRSRSRDRSRRREHDRSSDRRRGDRNRDRRHDDRDRDRDHERRSEKERKEDRECRKNEKLIEKRIEETKNVQEGEREGRDEKKKDRKDRKRKRHV